MTSSDSPPRRRDVPGLLGFVLAIVLTLTQIVQIGLSTAVPVLAFQAGLGVSDVGLLFTALGVGQLILAAATAVLGIVGVARRQGRAVLAGIALGVGGAGVVVGLTGLLLPPLLGFALQ
ncbi:hypothetical protein SAMN06295885_3114 [Rathayibacter oskolensis]|uniref:Major facilitator superfamily (MFS) profile domain-containing protein n=1 Tax=Rathayibacter oskolensis TaxID=1891671 RepID=A0A1X7PDB1_9MICO|nr:hypothetical protein [Rathayibacter oskolensis]SMH48731.1 hypothetical protein SAMN06295885_3114 [Rathayibacter oskolensis]